MVSAPVWGTGGRRFESCLPDHYSDTVPLGPALASLTVPLALGGSCELLGGDATRRCRPGTARARSHLGDADGSHRP